MRPPVIGAIFAGFLVVSPIILGGHISLMFFSLGGILIVGGGVITVAFMSFDAADVHQALDAIVRLFKKPETPKENLHDDMTAIIYCAKLVLEKGMRDFESLIGKVGIRDPFVKYGLNMVVSQYPAEDVRMMMETAANAAHERDTVPVEILQAMTSHAPAFGMIGTLVGMVIMLCHLTGDTSGIGPSLAVAFLSTLYGVLSARLIYIPAAAKLQQEVAERRFRNHLITEGMVMLVGKKTPMYVQDRLNSFLRLEAHDYYNVIKVAPNATRQAAMSAA
jgi:chemotaxis protein MotA